MSELALQLIKQNKETKNSKLDLSNCSLNYELWTQLFDCNWIKELDLHYSEITDISFLKKLTGLQSLDISSSRISDISFLQEFTGLQSLDLSGNGISDFSVLEKLTELKYLCLGYNNISDISFLEKLTNLQTLYLGKNQISDISSLGKLSQLRSLNIRYNSISDTKQLYVFLKLTKLKYLDLDVNPFLKNLPAEVRSVGWNAIKDWLIAEKKNEFVLINEFKLLLLGNTTSGKSTLLEYFQTNKVNQNIDSTFGIQYRLLDGLSKDMNINCWDFGGQEYFHATHQLFFSPGALYLVLWNRDEQLKKYAKEHECFRLDYWFRCIEQLLNDFEEIKNTVKKTEVIVCENKLKDSNGVFEFTSINQSLYSKKFSNLNFEYKNINLIPEVTEYLSTLKDSIFLKGKSLCNLHSPKIKEYLDKIRSSDKSFMRLDDFEKDDSEAIISRIKVIRNMGIVIYFENIMPEKVFTKPQLLLDLLYKKILSENLQQSNKSYKITKAEIIEALKNNELDISLEEMVTLLKQFNLVFEITTEENTFFIPQYMKEKSNEDLNVIQKKYKKEANIFIKSDYYLMNLAMLKVYSKYGTDVKMDNKKNYLFWKDGLIIEKGVEMLLIKFNREKQRIELYPTTNKSSFNLQQQVVDFILHNNQQYYEEGINWSSKYFEVYVGNNSGYFIGWKKFVNDVKLGLRKSVGYLNGEQIEEDEKGEAIDFYELKNFLPVNVKIEENEKPKIFFSYAWGEEREKIVDDLYDALSKEDVYELLRDKKEVNYKDSILSFMQSIGKGKFVIVALSEKYIESEYCMFELNELYKNSNQDFGELIKKIFLLRVENLSLNDPLIIKKYLSFWKRKEEEWHDLVTNMPAEIGIAQHKEYRKIKSISENLGDLINGLHYINTLTNEILAQNNFQKIKDEIKKRAEQL